ncbi:MAG: hypothetical protein QOK05_793 [Chloroflexota bacterium]|nr:hypothetical protein [Chloroflexota bacterium]
MEANRVHWNELAAVNAASEFYDLEGIREGRSTLYEWELEEVGDVSGRSLLHLQCHIGTDTVSWARRGAIVTGVDFAADALREARALATDCGVEVRFVQSNIYNLATTLEGQFDIVYTSRGVLGWMPDLAGWAKVVGRFVKPGGIFYIEEYHPLCWLLDEKKDAPAFAYDYFAPDPIVDETPGSYADASARVEHPRTYGWNYRMGDLVSFLVAEGFRIEFLHERPGCGSQVTPYLVQDPSSERRRFIMPPDQPQVPLSFSLRAVREG